MRKIAVSDCGFPTNVHPLTNILERVGCTPEYCLADTVEAVSHSCKTAEHLCASCEGIVKVAIKIPVRVNEHTNLSPLFAGRERIHIEVLPQLKVVSNEKYSK